MTSTLEIVKELHRTFNHPIHDKPYLNDHKLTLLRIELLREELEEFVTALKEYYKVPTIQSQCLILDALCDMQVVLDGAFLSLGFHRIKDESFLETHKSNMSKLGPDGNPITRADGKFLKGPNFVPPNYYPIIKKLLEE